MSDKFPKPSGDCITDRMRQNAAEAKRQAHSSAPPGSAFVGHLATETPLRGIFPDGMIPLAGPLASDANLGDGPNAQRARVYFVAVSACTPEQKEGMAKLMHSMGQGSLEEARKAVATNEPIPIREKNLAGVSFPLRYIM